MLGCLRWLCISTSLRSWCSTWDCWSWLLKSTFKATIWLLCFRNMHRSDWHFMSQKMFFVIILIQQIFHLNKTSSGVHIKEKKNNAVNRCINQCNHLRTKSALETKGCGMLNVWKELVNWPSFLLPDKHDQTFLVLEAFQCRSHWASISFSPSSKSLKKPAQRKSRLKP